MPGDNVTMEVELIHQLLSKTVLNSHPWSGRTVGPGSVASIENNFLKIDFQDYQFWIVFFIKKIFKLKCQTIESEKQK